MCEVDSFMLRLTKIIFFYKIALIFNVAIQKKTEGNIFKGSVFKFVM